MLIKILFIFLFLLPITFQILFGIKAIKGKLKLWQVSIVSCAGQIIVTIVNYYLISSLIKQTETHDGLPLVGVVSISLVLGFVLLIVILIQAIVYSRKLKIREKQ